MDRKGPFVAWANQAHPELSAQSRAFDAAGGAALRQLGEAWLRAGRPVPDQPLPRPREEAE